MIDLKGIADTNTKFFVSAQHDLITVKTLLLVLLELEKERLIKDGSSSDEVTEKFTNLFSQYQEALIQQKSDEIDLIASQAGRK